MLYCVRNTDNKCESLYGLMSLFLFTVVIMVCVRRSHVPHGTVVDWTCGIFFTSALEGGEGSASRPGRTLPPGKTRYPLYRRLGGPQGRAGQVRKISPPPGFNSRTVQPVGSRYTDWATGPTRDQPHGMNFKTTKEEICQETAIWFYAALNVKYFNNVPYNILYNSKNILITLIII